MGRGIMMVRCAVYKYTGGFAKMKIIISPAKKMNIRTDEPVEFTEPVYLKKGRMFMEYSERKGFSNAAETVEM